MNFIMFLKRTFLAATMATMALSASASLNLKLDISSAKNMNILLNNGTDEYIFGALTSDPYIYTLPLSRDLEADEIYVSFEYISDRATDHTQLFFGHPATEQRSQFYNGLPQAGQWVIATFNIAEQRKAYNWGAKGERLRLDFGRIAGLNMCVRHLRIHKAKNDPWVNDPVLFATIEGIKELGLPVVEINTINKEEPTCTYVGPPAGSIGAGIRNATKVPGSVKIHLTDGTVGYDSGEYEQGASGMTVKIRGNTSAFTTKKPYKIKLQKKGDLLCRGNKKYNDKNWVLLKDEDNKMRNGFKLNELIGGHPWTPACMYVNVVFNGDYRGMYLLTEAVERNTDCRLDVSKTGFIAELDPYWWNEDGQFFLSNRNPVHNYTLKYPDFEDLTPEQSSYIQNTLSAYEAAMKMGMYNCIDVESFARWMLGHDILGTLDAGGSNMYYMKYDNTTDSKIMMCNMWDFDSTERCEGDWSYIHTYHFSNFFNHNLSREFITAYCNKWNEVSPYIFDEMIAFLNQFAASDEGRAFDRSAVHDGLVYSTTPLACSTNTARAVKWYTDRRKFLTPKIAALEKYSGVEDVAVDAEPEGNALAPVFNLMGQMVLSAASEADLNQLPSGIYIYKGKKIALK